jgi:error-prone DNA polymerase
MHPAEVEKVYGWRYEFPVTHLTTSRQIQFKSNGDRCVVFGIVIVRQAPPTAKGILFLTLEDEFGFINCMVRPKIYETQPLDHEVFLCLEGKLQKDGSSHSIVIERKILPKVETAEYLELQEKKFQNDSPSFFSVRNFY